MYPSLKKVGKERLADMVQNIIKKMSKEEIGESIKIEVKRIFFKKRDREIALTLKERAIRISQKQRHHLV